MIEEFLIAKIFHGMTFPWELFHKNDKILYHSF